MNDAVHDKSVQGLPTGTPPAILVVDPDSGAREFMRFSLSKCCGTVQVADSVGAAVPLLAERQWDLLVVNTLQRDGSGVEWVADRRDKGDRTPVIFVSAQRDAGDTHHVPGSEHLPVPFSLNQLVDAVGRVLETSPMPSQRTTSDPDTAEFTVEGVVHHSEAMSGLLRLVRRVARGTTTVLLEGESGTGKEVIARCLHHYSGRRGAFVPINCSSISPELLESELFGHTRGAFTGATQQREGVFSYAHGGTLLLDEICEMPHPMQAKLLRVLEERAIRPVGAEREQHVDVRVVAATNRSMIDEVMAGNFREDLYYRINVLALRLPPLRERPGDILPLVRFFANRLSRELGVPPLELGETDLRKIRSYDWPGNVRELKNLVERAMLLGSALGDCLGTSRTETPYAMTIPWQAGGYPDDLPLADVQRLHILKALDAAGGNKSEAARRLQVSRKTLERKLKIWGKQRST